MKPPIDTPAVISSSTRPGVHSVPAASANGTLLVASAGPRMPWVTIWMPM